MIIKIYYNFLENLEKYSYKESDMNFRNFIGQRAKKALCEGG